MVALKTKSTSLSLIIHSHISINMPSSVPEYRTSLREEGELGRRDPGSHQLCWLPQRLEGQTVGPARSCDLAAQAGGKAFCDGKR